MFDDILSKEIDPKCLATDRIHHPFYELSSDETISDDGYAEVAFPPNVRLWLPSNLDDAKRRELLNEFGGSYLVEATLESEAVRGSLWGLGVIFIPPFFQRC
ncbi:MAG: hypothetical protein WA441_03435 [Methyloceanibacter sp.]